MQIGWAGDLDFAVHSAKDRGDKIAGSLFLQSYLPRRRLSDAVIGRTAPN